MTKTKQPELLLQADICGRPGGHNIGPLGLRGQGFWVDRTSDRMKAGKPDIRVARQDQGQLDIELKVSLADLGAGWDPADEIDLGFTKLQWLNLKTMNENAVPAIGLVFFAKHNVYMLTLDRVLCQPFPDIPYTCLSYPRPKVIDGPELFTAARKMLRAKGYQYPHWS